MGSPSSEAVNTAPSSLCSVTVTCSRSSGPRHGDLVVAVGAVERRDVHLLLGAGPALLVRVDEVGVPVAVGVVHLDHHAGELAVAAVAPEHADRVEAVAERAGVGGHHDAAAVGLDAVERRGSARRCALIVRVGVAEVVARLEPAEDAVVGQVVEVDQPGARAVGEGALERLAAGVPDRGGVRRGLDRAAASAPSPHSTPSCAAASTPERAPSSWKPQPCQAPAKTTRSVSHSGRRRWAATEAGV